jgi:hypothetical protein
MLVSNLSTNTAEKESRQKRILKRRQNGQIDNTPEHTKQANVDLKCKLSCANKNLVNLWFLTLGLRWEKGGVGKMNTLQDAIFACMSERGFEVDELNWVAYKVCWIG